MFSEYHILTFGDATSELVSQQLLKKDHDKKGCLQKLMHIFELLQKRCKLLGDLVAKQSSNMHPAIRDLYMRYCSIVSMGG